MKRRENRPLSCACANLAVGTELFTQWFVLKPAGSSLLQVSNGMGFRLSAF